MVVVSHLFSLLAINFRGGCDSKESHPPLYKIIYFPTAPFFIIMDFFISLDLTVPSVTRLDILSDHDGGLCVLDRICGEGSYRQVIKEKLYRTGTLEKGLLTDGGGNDSIQDQLFCTIHRIVGNYL